MAKYDEVEIIKRAYDELKALDYDGQLRAVAWLSDRFTSDYHKAIEARAQATRERIAQRTGADHG